MLDAGLVVEVDLGAEAQAQTHALGEEIDRAAEECCRLDDAFVMIRTEVRDGVVVKTVEFDQPNAARRFRHVMSQATNPA